MKKVTFLAFLLVAVLVLSGCSHDEEQEEIVYALNTVLKTTDSGETWKLASEDNTGKTILIPEILSLEVDPIDSEKVYAGTEKDGLFLSEDGGATWSRIDFPLARIFGLGIGRGDMKALYASGLLKERAKVYKSLNEGLDWEEIYSEPANGTVISSLAVSRKNSDLVYVGTSEGMIIKTVDGGKTWKNLTKAEGPVTTIAFDSANDSEVYFLVFNNTILRSSDGGEKFEDLSEELGTGFFDDGKPFFLVTDPSVSGRVYAGMSNGFLGGSKFGEKFEALNVIESSKKFPIRALAVSPQNSAELFYSSAQAIYKSIDGGKTWATFQLDTVRTGSQLKYDPRLPSTIYLGLRKN